MNTQLTELPLLEKKFLDTGNIIRTVIEGLGFGLLSLALYAIPMSIAYALFNIFVN